MQPMDMLCKGVVITIALRFAFKSSMRLRVLSYMDSEEGMGVPAKVCWNLEDSFINLMDQIRAWYP